ncbi:MAG: SMC-Scp complex subunit ScpB [Ureaplasma sp.]|nr:SMC-Scp complex subunit ScpB [Ureaplasma sp.]
MDNKKENELIQELFEDDLDDESLSKLSILKNKLDEQHNSTNNIDQTTNEEEFDFKYTPNKIAEEFESIAEFNKKQNSKKKYAIDETNETDSITFMDQKELEAISVQNQENQKEIDILDELNNETNFSFDTLKKLNKTSQIDKKIELENSTNEYLKTNNLSIQKIRKIIESTLYVMGDDGMTLSDLKHLLDLPTTVLSNILNQMIKEKDLDVNSGLCIKQFGNRYKILTKDETYNDICLVLNKKEKKPLNKTKLEVLSIIAYTQPCTRKAIEKIRARDCTNILMSLLELGLIQRNVGTHLPGRPKLYTVTHKFFDLFGLKSLNELPKIERTSHESVQALLNNLEDDYDDEVE